MGDARETEEERTETSSSTRRRIAVGIAAFTLTVAIATTLSSISRLSKPVGEVNVQQSPKGSGLGEAPALVSSGPFKGRTACRLPFHGYSDGHWYPPAHPTVPELRFDDRTRLYLPAAPRGPEHPVKLERCFSLVAVARTAGFRDAVLPAGWIDLDGAFLSPSFVGLVCPASAKQLGFAVPCPGLGTWPRDWHCGPAAGRLCISADRFELASTLLAQGIEGADHYSHSIDFSLLAAKQSLPSRRCLTQTDEPSSPVQIEGREAYVISCETTIITTTVWKENGISYELTAEAPKARKRETLEDLTRITWKAIHELSTHTPLVGG